MVGTVVTCPSANLALLYRVAATTSDPNTNGIGGYGHSYPFLGYYDGYTFSNNVYNRQKMTSITKPADTIFNSDALDRFRQTVRLSNNTVILNATSFAKTTFPNRPTYYTRHGKGDNYAWGDGHVQFMPWLQVSAGRDGLVNWYWMIKK